MVPGVVFGVNPFYSQPIYAQNGVLKEARRDYSVHDYYALRAEYDSDRQVLMFELKRRRGVGHTGQVESRTLSFTGVSDLDCVPTISGKSGRSAQSGVLRWLASRLQRATRNATSVKSARDLVLAVGHPSTARGEPLNYIRRLNDGFAVVTHLVGEHYVQAENVESRVVEE